MVGTAQFQSNDGKNDVGSWPFNKPFYVILNLAWGGDWGGMKGVDESALLFRWKWITWEYSRKKNKAWFFTI